MPDLSNSEINPTSPGVESAASLTEALASSLRLIAGESSLPRDSLVPGRLMRNIHPFPSTASFQSSPILRSIYTNDPRETLLLALEQQSRNTAALLQRQALLAHHPNAELQRAILSQSFNGLKPILPQMTHTVPTLKEILSSQAYSNRTSYTAPVIGHLAGGDVTERTNNTLVALGSNRRRGNDPYIDISSFAVVRSTKSEFPRKSRGGVNEPFPEKLYRVLMDMEEEASDIASFSNHGRAFCIHKPDVFVKEILPKYFKMSKWGSFARQLNLYGFSRVQAGPDAGGFYHELFLKGHPHLCEYMRRVGIPSGKIDRRKMRSKEAPADPDFYSMPPLTGST